MFRKPLLVVPPYEPEPTCKPPGSSCFFVQPSALQRSALSGRRRALRESILPSVFSSIHPSIPFRPLLSRCTQGAAVNRVHPGCLPRVKEGGCAMDKLPVYCGGDTPRLINNRRLSQLTESGPLPISLMRMSSPRGGDERMAGGGASEPQPKP